ncbi:MAG: hypothetical protein WCH76_08150, partial [Candidatus Riflemargulisbacteria bacterium]
MENETTNELGIDNAAIEAVVKEVAATGININLTEDEKQKIEENKKKRGRPPGTGSNATVAAAQPAKTPEPVRIITSDFGNVVMTDDEMKQCADLQRDLNAFILDKADIATSDGIVETLPTGIDLLDAVLGGGFGDTAATVIATLN